MLEKDQTLGALREPLEDVLRAQGADGARHAHHLSTFAGSFDTHEARTITAWEQEMRTILEKLMASLDNELDEKQRDVVRQAITAAKTILVMGGPAQQSMGVTIFESKVRGLNLSSNAQELFRRFLLMTSVQPTAEAKKEAVIHLMQQIQLAAQAVLAPTPAAPGPQPSVARSPASPLTSRGSLLFTNARVEAILGSGIPSRRVTDAEIIRILDKRVSERYIETGDGSYNQLLLVQPDQQILFRSPNGAVLIKVTRIEEGRPSFGTSPQVPQTAADQWNMDPTARARGAVMPSVVHNAAFPNFQGKRYHYHVANIINRPLG